jgi:hypothetical protein
VREIEAGTIVPPTASTSGAAKIAVFAGEHVFFSLSEENVSLPSLERFSKPFEDLLAIAASPLKLDYVVALLSPAVLHPLAVEKFSTSISQLLEHQFCIQLKLCRSSNSEVRQDRMVLAMIVSRSYADLPWDSMETNSKAEQVTGLEAMINDLAITNARPDDSDSSGFLCSVRPMSDDEVAPMATAAIVNVYNHHIGNNLCAWDILDKAYMRPFVLGREARLKHPSKCICANQL